MVTTTKSGPARGPSATEIAKPSAFGNRGDGPRDNDWAREDAAERFVPQSRGNYGSDDDGSYVKRVRCRRRRTRLARSFRTSCRARIFSSGLVVAHVRRLGPVRVR